MKNSYYYLLFLTFMLMACNNNPSNSSTAGIRPENLDKTAHVGEDFYQFACGGWMKNNPITGEYSRFGAFDQLAENNRKQLQSLIEEIATQENEPASVAQKIGDLYNIAMDSVKLNAEGFAPIKNQLDQLAALENKSELNSVLAESFLSGTPTFFSVYVRADPMNSTQNMVATYQSGISLGNREYYLEKDETSVKIRNEYKNYVVKMFELCGFTTEQAQKNMEDVMRIETRIAQSHFDKEKTRDPYQNYHKMSVDDLQKLVPNIEWKTIFKTLELDIKDLSVSQKEPIIEVGKIIESEPMSALIAYLQWKTINSSASYLSDDIFNENFNFYGKILSGKTEASPRWKRAQSSVNESLGEALGQLYVAKYFPAEAKERMVKLVANLQDAYRERIQNLEWMGDSTKTKAIEKLNSIYVKIGYPNKWKDYSKLEIKNDSYVANIERASRLRIRQMFDKASQAVDKEEWFMTPQTVNAYYNPTTNEICFPAGILQYPFFDMNADDAFNYGAIGVVIGHEITHGFDDQGRQYDKDGNLKNWWTKEDADNFKARAQVMINFFDNIEVAPGVQANGTFTLGENLADHGGLQMSFQAYKKATENNPLAEQDGLTADQRFFVAYSNVWAGNIRHEEILRRTKTDPHSLGKWRVNGALPHIEEWYKAFDIKETDSLYIAPEKRVTIW